MDAEGGSRRTQFDEQVLPGSVSAGVSVPGSAGRRMLARADGSLLAALAWDEPTRSVLRVWRGRALMASAAWPRPLSAPILIETDGVPSLWFSANGTIYSAARLETPPRALAGITGTLEDAAPLAEGGACLAVRDQDRLHLHWWDGAVSGCVFVDDGVGRVSLEPDEAGVLHLAYEKRQGLEYRCFGSPSVLLRAERAAEAFGSAPTLLAAHGRLFLAYLGESCRVPSPQPRGDAWERLGRGGYVAVLERELGAGGAPWRRFTLADSRQIAKGLWPRHPSPAEAIGNSEVRLRIEELGAPAIARGPDGAVQVLWANLTRRWLFAARFLGAGGFSPAAEVRGPIEQLGASCFVPKRVPETFAGVPVVVATATRACLDEIRVPPRQVSHGRRIDFLQPDEIMEMGGLDFTVCRMERHPRNPVLPVGTPGSFDDGALVADISRDSGVHWRATYNFRSAADRASGRLVDAPRSGRAVSRDGLAWTKLDPVLKGAMRVTIEDPDEPNPAFRWKGLEYVKDLGGARGAYRAVVSRDGVSFTQVEDPTGHLVGNDDLSLWRDPDDAPARRFKASAISWSHGGRVAVQWTSPDGMHWNDERDTLDWDDPFGAPAHCWTTGRILVDAWAGPDIEDEIHGGFVFRDGDRWLLHYMPWTADGHIYVALASSRDGVNFTRVAGGAATLPLGEAGTWDAGRVALREGPFRIGGASDVWRQYYVGGGWKHGMGGIGNLTSPFGVNAPNQTGCAEIRVGRWGALRLGPEAFEGALVTTVLALEVPHRLELDVGGLGTPHAAVAVAVLASAPRGGPGAAVPGHELAACDPIGIDGGRVAVSWRGRGLEDLGPGRIHLAVRVAGHGVRLFGLNLVPA